MWPLQKRQQRGGGKGYPFVTCPSHSTIDHAPLSRRSNRPYRPYSSTKETPPTAGCSIPCFHVSHRTVLLLPEIYPLPGGVCAHVKRDRSRVVWTRDPHCATYPFMGGGGMRIVTEYRGTPIKNKLGCWSGGYLFRGESKKPSMYAFCSNLIRV